MMPVIYKTDDKWVVEFKDGNAIRRTKPTSRIKAINSYFNFYPLIECFAIVPLSLPVKEVNNGDNDSNASRGKMETKGLP